MTYEEVMTALRSCTQEGECDRCLDGKDSVDATAFAYAEKKKPMTNADRIRSKSDEELAALFEEYGDCPPRYCPHDGKGTKITRIDCRECWIDWLRQEAGDERTAL